MEEVHSIDKMSKDWPGDVSQGMGLRHLCQYNEREVEVAMNEGEKKKVLEITCITASQSSLVSPIYTHYTQITLRKPILSLISVTSCHTSPTHTPLSPLISQQLVR